MNYYYTGETVSLFFEAKDRQGESVDLSTHDISAVLTGGSGRVPGVIERTGVSTFRVDLASADTRRLGVGVVTVVVTLTAPGVLQKEAFKPFAIKDALQQCGCVPTTERPTPCGVLRITVDNTIVDGTGGAGLVLAQWKADKQAIAEAISLQGVPTEPTDPGTEMAEKIRNFQLAVPGDPSLVAPPVSYPDLWKALYNNQRAGYGAMWGCMYAPLFGEFILSGADAYLTSDGRWITTDGVIEIDSILPFWVLYYKIEEEHGISELSQNIILSMYLYRGRCTTFNTPQNLQELFAGEWYFFLADSLKNSFQSVLKIHIENEIPECAVNGLLGAGTIRYAHVPIQNYRGASLYGAGTAIPCVFVFVKNFTAPTNAFQNAGSVKKVVFETTETIGAGFYFFNNMSALGEVVFKNIRTLSNTQMFTACPRLKRIELPATEGGSIGNAWYTCVIEDLELEQGFSKPINLQSLVTITDRALFRDHFIDRLGETTEAHVIRLNATFNALLTAEDIQAITDKGYIVQFP